MINCDRTGFAAVRHVAVAVALLMKLLWCYSTTEWESERLTFRLLEGLVRLDLAERYGQLWSVARWLVLRTDRWGDISNSFTRDRRRCRYRAVGGAEGLGTLIELEQPKEGPFVRGREKVSLLLERESRQDRRTIESTLPGVGYGPQVRSIQGLDCALPENLLAWNHARGMVLREGTSWSSWERQALLLSSTTECGYRAASIATKGKSKPWQKNMTS